MRGNLTSRLGRDGLVFGGGLLVLSMIAAAGSRAPTSSPDTLDGAETVKAPSVGDPIELAFITHLDADLPEQDVFIERVPGSGEVFRVTKGDHDMSAPLYATAVETKHDPFDPAAVGPHPKGRALGFSLGEWLAHAGSGTYSCEDGVGKLRTTFTGLVPNGVYTMWHAFMAMPPTTPFSGTLDLPLGARDGSESVFRANSDGRAAYDRDFRPCLEMSDVWTTSMLAVNYHSDGKTYLADPGQFGLYAHIPLFIMLPNRDGL